MATILDPRFKFGKFEDTIAKEKNQIKNELMEVSLLM